MFYNDVLDALKARRPGIFPVFLLALALSAAPAFARSADTEGSQETGPGSPADAGSRVSKEKTVAIFPFELIDSSLEGEMFGKNEDETARLQKLAPQLREDIEKLDDYTVIDTSSMDKRVESVNLRSCGNCGVAFAKELGADVAILGTVQKVSNLILNINAYVYDVSSGDEIARGSADIRSNTDRSWRRGIDYLFDAVLKKQLEKRS